MEDEIDLRKYIDVLLRHWKLIVSITVIAILVAGLVSFLSPFVYEAKAGVLIIQTKAEIILEPKINKIYFEDIASQREALVAMVKSSTVATQVIEQLGDKLEPEERRLGNLVDKVQVRGQGNFIEISVKSTDPQKAAAIANAWAESYESYVNGLSPEWLQAQADFAKKEYEEKQKVWEGFISDNRIDELRRQIADKELLCDVKLLREHIGAGPSSPASVAANNLAFILLQARAFTSLPVEFQVSLDRLSSLNVSIDDIDALISTLEARSGGTRGQSISELRQEINRLKADLEQERATERKLENSRDIAREVYTTVAGQVMEAEIAARAQGAAVQVVEVAVVPESPVAPRRVMNIGVALILGLVIGTFGAFGVEYFKRTGEKLEEGKEK